MTETPGMATLVDTATTTATEISVGAASRKMQRSNGQTRTEKSERPPDRKFNHVFAIHKRSKASPLGKDADSTPSFFGFKNLMALMLSTCCLLLLLI
jgi:diacylglycerol O-acyltransferase-1